MSLNIKNPICLVGSKVKKVVVDNVNMTIDVYTSEVPSEEPETPSYPTDLSHYIVEVPAGWTCTAGYGTFNLEGTLNSNSLYSLLIGFYPSGVEAVDSITDFSNGYTPSDSLIFYIDGGDDVTNQNLIQWFVSNNATFTYNHSGGA